MCSRGDDAVGRGSANAIGRGRATDDRGGGARATDYRGDRSRSRDGASATDCDDDRSRSRDRSRDGASATDYRAFRIDGTSATDDRGDRITIVWRYWDAGTGNLRDPTGRNFRALGHMTVRELQQEIALRHNHHPDRVDIYHPRFDPPRRLPWSATIAGEGMTEGQLLLVYLVPYSDACVRLSGQ